MSCSKFLPVEGAKEKWGTRYKPGSKVRMYTYDEDKWSIGEEMTLQGASTIMIGAFSAMTIAALL